jgi:hypothetical protein
VDCGADVDAIVAGGRDAVGTTDDCWCTGVGVGLKVELLGDVGPATLVILGGKAGALFEDIEGSECDCVVGN